MTVVTMMIRHRVANRRAADAANDGPDRTANYRAADSARDAPRHCFRLSASAAEDVAQISVAVATRNPSRHKILLLESGGTR